MNKYLCIVTRADYDRTAVYVWARHKRDARTLARRYADQGYNDFPIVTIEISQET